MQESLGKHVKLLETALKKERDKVRHLANGENVELGKDPKEAAKEQLNDLMVKRMLLYFLMLLDFDVFFVSLSLLCSMLLYKYPSLTMSCRASQTANHFRRRWN